MGRHGNTFCPRRAAKNGNCNFLLSTRAAEGREERQRQHLLSTKGREGPRRTATATPFVHGGPRRAAENGNGNTFCPRRATKGREERQRQHLLSTKGHEGPRRTATATSFCPRRGTHKGREERQLQLPFVHEGPRRTATATPFVHGGPLGAAENFLLIHGVRGVSGEESGVRGRSGRLSQGAQGLWRGRCAFWWLDDL